MCRDNKLLHTFIINSKIYSLCNKFLAFFVCLPATIFWRVSIVMEKPSNLLLLYPAETSAIRMTVVDDIYIVRTMLGASAREIPLSSLSRWIRPVIEWTLRSTGIDRLRTNFTLHSTALVQTETHGQTTKPMDRARTESMQKQRRRLRENKRGREYERGLS